MLRTIVAVGLISASALLTGCQTSESPYRGSQWRMDQVNDGDTTRPGSENRQEPAGKTASVV